LCLPAQLLKISEVLKRLIMRLFIIPLFCTSFLFACNKQALDTVSATDSTAMPFTQEPSIEKVPNDGRLYVSQDGQYRFRVLEENPKTRELIFKNDVSGRIYSMHQTISADGARYEDKDGNYMWLKGDNFMFGTNGTETANGTIAR